MTEARSRSTVRLCALGAATMALVSATTGHALAADYAVSAYAGKAQITTTGELIVSDSRTVRFSSEATSLGWDISVAKGQSVEFATVVGPEGGMYDRVREGDPTMLTPGSYIETMPPGAGVVHVQVAFRKPTSGTAVVKDDYIVKGAVRRWPDVGELLWDFIGDRWPVGTDDVRLEVTLPDNTPPSAVQAFVHGPEAVKIGISAAPSGPAVVDTSTGETVQVAVIDVQGKRLAARTPFRVRVLMPPAAVTNV